jgi:hypothetical protein
MIDYKQSHNNICAYGSRFGARMAMILHLLLNVRMMEGDHWSLQFLHRAKEIVLLLPMTKNNATMVAVGVMYLDRSNKAMFRQIDSKGKIEPPFVLSVVVTRSIQLYEDQE